MSTTTATLEHTLHSSTSISSAFHERITAKRIKSTKKITAKLMEFLGVLSRRRSDLGEVTLTEKRTLCMNFFSGPSFFTSLYVAY